MNDLNFVIPGDRIMYSGCELSAWVLEEEWIPEGFYKEESTSSLSMQL